MCTRLVIWWAREGRQFFLVVDDFGVEEIRPYFICPIDARQYINVSPTILFCNNQQFKHLFHNEFEKRKI